MKHAPVNTMIVLFNLKPGVSATDYEEWAKAHDMPTVRGLKSIDSFHTYRAVGVYGSDATPPYQYFEVLDLNDMDQFAADIATDTMGKIAAEFQELADNPLFIVTHNIED